MKDHTDSPGHEAYGICRLARISGVPGPNLFGTPLRPQHWVQLEIMEGSEYHGLGDTRYSSGKLIATVWMSEMQYAELITTMNAGTGTPCTLKYARAGAFVEYPDPPRQDSDAQRTRDEFRRNVDERMSTLKAIRRRIGSLLDEGRVGATRRKEIDREIHSLFRLFEDTAPFLMERFEENAERVTAQAKADITAHADLLARNIGIAAIREGVHVPLLSEGESA